MLTDSLTLVVPGTPAAKGSMKCVGRRGKVMHALVDSNTGTAPWMKRLASAFLAWWPADQHADPGQPVGLEVTFTFARPAAHFGTGRNAERLRDDAPLAPVARGTFDSDKLLRAIGDALEAAGVVVNDAQIVEVRGTKRYAEPDEKPGARITVRPLVAADPELVP